MTDHFSRRLRLMAPLLIDVVAPIVVYFALHALGVGDLLALTAGGVVAGANAIVTTVRRRRLDGVGVLVVLEIALSIVLLLTVRDPRILLIRPAFFAGVGGLFALATCVVGRPLGYQTSRPLATRGDPVRAEAYALAWERSPEFRRVERLITAGWGVALLAEAILRVIVVFRFGPDQIGQSLLASQLPGIVLIVVAVAFTRSFVPTLRRIVDGYVDALAAERAPQSVGAA
ncbi:MAG TPA: VC0807 family protein [Thermomicrobiales bacterium]|nr:VC0807 family protein [Thermomicrobiales bacterium]